MTQAFWAMPHHQAGMFLSGALLAMPSAVIDILLSEWAWTPERFGVGVLIQGCGALLGTIIVSRVAGRTGSSQAEGPRPLALSEGSLSVAAGLMGCAGTLLLYLVHLPWPGFFCCGAAIGILTTLANSHASCAPSGPRLLSLLNMCFTLGAVLCPALVAAILAWHGTASPGWQLWHIVPAALALWFVAQGFLTARAGTPARNVVPSLSAQAPDDARPKATKAPSHRLMTACGFLALFCYVATEVNLSNGWMLFLVHEENVPSDVARSSGPLFWLGLLGARVLFSLIHPQDSQILWWLKALGFANLAVLGTTLLLASDALVTLCSSASTLGGLGVCPSLLAIKAPPVFLTLAVLSGLTLGAIYAFILGAVTHHAALNRQHALTPQETSRRIAQTMQGGELGAMLMPPLAGSVATHWNHAAAMVTIFLTQAVFVTAIFLWPRREAVTQHAKPAV